MQPQVPSNRTDPMATATRSNSTVYKNCRQGLYTHDAGNEIIKGEYFVDNKTGLDVLQDNTINIQDINMVQILVFDQRTLCH